MLAASSSAVHRMIGIAPALVRCPDQAADIDGRGQLSDAQQDALQHLLDLEAIKQTEGPILPCRRSQDLEFLSEVFTRDAVLELPERDVKVQGRDAIVTFVRKCWSERGPSITVTRPRSTC